MTNLFIIYYLFRGCLVVGTLIFSAN